MFQDVCIARCFRMYVLRDVSGCMYSAIFQDVCTVRFFRMYVQYDVSGCMYSAMFQDVCIERCFGMFSRISMGRSSLRPWRFALNMGSSSH